ncbi:glycosyltransferase family 4 protein [Candidatus Oleimmundimicrobium sp.]|uniref:glycosyltransferase family 4 protein n=1 Tax=Candidatus Oleimmundimicrobium sp. TaxID=3060597 RepID=UPI002724CABC|nr:glycosyltransferase family 4 protein [Candidatus Oleimmundimicrobium sp.]MDO8886098.1 glycosyltransferase family 4 protein [Candidatus Oleimmundimicrobium sp.]
MKIAQLAPVWERVPPVKYGGIEMVVYLLTEELVKRGHEVTLFATGDSKTSAELSSIYHTRPPRNLLAGGDLVPDLLHVTSAFKRADEFDIIHNHAGYCGIALANFVSTPVLTTLHGPFMAENKRFFKTFKDAVYYNSISDAQKKGLAGLNYVGTIYNAIDVDRYEFKSKKKDYFLFLSRITADKGAHTAIDVAKKAGVNLIMAGKIDPGSDTEYFEKMIYPQIDGKQIKFLGEVTDKRKKELLRDAKAFLFPLQWPEPFGLVMIEAMAAGTPVIAFPYGSVPEIVIDGESGFIVNSVEEMIGAITKIDKIDLFKCRNYVEKKFGATRMVDDYEEVYKKIIKRHNSSRG